MRKPMLSLKQREVQVAALPLYFAAQLSAPMMVMGIILETAVMVGEDPLVRAAVEAALLSFSVAEGYV